MDNKKALIIGYGGVESFGTRAVSFGIRVSVLDNSYVPRNSFIENFYLFEDIETAVKNKDIIFITCPLTDLTKNYLMTNLLEDLRRVVF